MLSELELRSIIEGSFLPRRCECTKAEDAALTIKVYDDSNRDRVDLEVKGIKAQDLVSSRAICELVIGLRKDLEELHQPTLQRAGARGYYY